MDKIEKDNITITDLIDIAHQDALEHGWWDNPPEFGTSIALVHTELSEALDEARDGRAYNETYYQPDGKPEGIPSELADVLIRIFDLCGYYNIELEKAVIEKMKFNRTRPYKHGKEF